MNTLYLDRYESTEGGTRGRLFKSLDSEPWLYTIEQPNRDNSPFVSCIPAGVYTVTPHDSPKHGPCLLIIGGTVSEDKGHSARYACLFHVANWADQVEGCVGVGGGEHETDRGPMVTGSRDAMAELLADVTETTQLIVRHV
tara:strand:- start:23 stop:445 length:423 start_codon:yes stop_codon:yes gene_type:complete